MKRCGIVIVMILGLLGVLTFVSLMFLQTSSQNSVITRQMTNSVRSHHLALTGYEYALSKMRSLAITSDEIYTFEQIVFGEGTYSPNGDVFIVQSSDLNSKININDGILAGALEVKQKDNVPVDESFSQYHANALDPWPTNTYEDPIRIHPQSNQEILDQARSALLNLRIRRLLNAYGDVHRYIDQSYEGDYHLIGNDNWYDFENLPSPPVPVFSTHKFGADGHRGQSMIYEKNLDSSNNWKNYNNGLGDRILEMRPDGGYKNLEEIKEIVNQWSQDPGIELSREYLQRMTFFEKITQDLTVISYEDDRFFRLDDEARFGYFEASVTADHGDFAPRDLQLDPVDFSNMWRDHSVPLININDASFFVKAAVFYAPTNVSYLVEGATTIPPYVPDPNSPGNGLPWFDSETAIESMIASPSIGVAPATLLEVPEDIRAQDPDVHLEHGQYVGRKSHLISMKDALWQAYKYGQYLGQFPGGSGTNEGHDRNFDVFQKFLMGSSSATVGGGGFGDDDDDDGGTFNFDVFCTLERSFIDTGKNRIYKEFEYNAGGQYYISDFIDGKEQGEFVNDYLARTLPYILSCVRRLPGYLGAPEALQSPYLIVKPDYEREAYKRGELCRQGFYKAEDFVWRFTHPKVCFLPLGYSEIFSQGSIFDSQGRALTTSRLKVVLKSFETHYYRTQDDFLKITDQEGLTHQEIKIGPHFPDQTPSSYLGFVGVKDYSDDYIPFKLADDRDLYMTMGDDYLGYHPQIILNFDHEEIQGKKAYRNYASRFRDGRLTPDIQDDNQDKWIDAINNDPPNSEFADTLKGSAVEGSESPVFADTRLSSGMSDLSPFGGIYFHSFNHGEFASGGFNDSLYYRLNDWLQPGTVVGEDLSAGLMTFWFQIPCGYYYPTSLRVNETEIFGTSFSQALVSLNLWESYEYGSLGQSYQRPISLVVGLKHSKERSLCVFARYDTGNEPYYGVNPNPYSFTAPKGWTPQTGSYENGANPVYNSLSFLCNSLHQDPPYNYREDLNPDPYAAYRYVAHRSSEVAVSLKDKKDCALGSWHRVGVYWDFRWDPRQSKNMESRRQLYIDLFDASSRSQDSRTLSLGEYLDDQNIFYENVQQAPPGGGFVAGTPFEYAADSATTANRGFMHPFDSTMVLSLGESHGRRFFGYKMDKGNESQPGTYYPFWRANTCLDNLRIWLGPSNPNHPERAKIPEEYFNPETIAETILGDGELGNWGATVHESLRYSIFPSGDIRAKISRPVWVIKKAIPKGSHLLHLSSRIYYPQDDNKNTSQVFFYATSDEKLATNVLDSSNGHPILISAWQQTSLSEKETDLVYYPSMVDENFAIIFHYSIYKPKFDGSFRNIGRDPDEKIQFSYEYNNSKNEVSGDDFISIPWIQEMSVRYISPESEQILKWEEN